VSVVIMWIGVYVHWWSFVDDCECLNKTLIASLTCLCLYTWWIYVMIIILVIVMKWELCVCVCIYIYIWCG